MCGDGGVAVAVDDGDSAVMDAHVLSGLEVSADGDPEGVSRRLIELPRHRLVRRGRLLWIGHEIADVENVEVVARHAHSHRPSEAALLLDLDLHRRRLARPA